MDNLYISSKKIYAFIYFTKVESDVDKSFKVHDVHIFCCIIIFLFISCDHGFQILLYIIL